MGSKKRWMYSAKATRTLILQRSPQHPAPTHYDDQGDGHRHEQLDHRQDRGRKAPGPQVGVEMVGVIVVEPARVNLLAIKALDNPHAGDVLLQVGVHLGDGLTDANKGGAGRAPAR